MNVRIRILLVIPFLGTWCTAAAQAKSAEPFATVLGGSPSGPALNMNIVPSRLAVSAHGTIYGCCIGNISGFQIRSSGNVSPFPINRFISGSNEFLTDGKGRVIVAESGRITRVDLDSNTSDTIAESIHLDQCGEPRAVDEDSNIYCANGVGGDVIDRIDPHTGTITRIAGSGATYPPYPPFGVPNGDGSTAKNAILGNVFRMTLNPSGDLLFLEAYRWGGGITFLRRVDSRTGIISTVLNSKDIGPSISIQAFTADSQFVYAATSNSIVMRVDIATGKTQKLVGNGTAGYSGDGGSGSNAALNNIQSVALDHSNGLLIADFGNNRVRRVDLSTGVITTVAGNGEKYFAGEGTPAASASIGPITAMAFDSSGNLYVADCVNSRVRMVNAASGMISTIAGNGTPGYSGDGGLATKASINGPVDITLDTANNLFIADALNHVVRRVDARSGVITTIAGNGGAIPDGENGLATTVALGKPTGIAVTTSGYLWIGDYDSFSLRRVNLATGRIQWVKHLTPNSGYSNQINRISSVGDRIIAYLGPHYAGLEGYDEFSFGLLGNRSSQFQNGEGEWPNPQLVVVLEGGTCTGSDLGLLNGSCLLGSLAIDNRGNIYASEPGQGRVRRISGISGSISNVAAAHGFLWNDLLDPQAIAISHDQVLYIAARKSDVGYVVVSLPMK